MGPQRSNPTSDDGQFPHPKDQHGNDQDDEEFWDTQVRHESHLSHRDPVRTFKDTESPKFGLSLESCKVRNDGALGGLGRGLLRGGVSTAILPKVSTPTTHTPLAPETLQTLAQATSLLPGVFWCDQKLSLDCCIPSHLGSCLEVLIVIHQNREFVLAFGHAYPCHSTIVGALPVWSTS